MIAQIATIGQMQTKRNVPKINVQIKKSDKAVITTKVVKPVRLLNPSTPYFERNNFISEEVNMQEIDFLHDLGFTKMTEEDLIETKVALNLIGYDPAIKLLNLMIENDVLGFARPGIDNHPHLNLLTKLLPKLKKEAGVTHIALALPKSLQRLLDVFIITGEILPNLSPVNLSDYGLQGMNDYVSLLKAARLAGYQLIAIEPDMPVQAFDPRRDQIMAETIKSILRSADKSKVIFLAPDRHLSYSSVGDWIPVAGILKEKEISIFTINQYWHSDFMPKVFTCLLKRLTRPIAIASKDVKMFAALQSRSLSLENVLPNNWDLTIVYPKTCISKNRLLKQAILKLGEFFNTDFLVGKYQISLPNDSGSVRRAGEDKKIVS